MIKATNSITGKINIPQNLKGKTNASIIREYPELENIEITPTVEDQTYTPTKYGFEEVKVKGVQAYIDEDIKPEYIKDGVDILGVIGNVVELQGEEKTIIPSTTQQIIVPSDGKNGMTRLTVEAVDSSIDENIKPENIKEGTNILGVDGQYRGIDTSDATATADDILKGKTSYSQNEEITGTIETYDGSYEGNVGEENNTRIVEPTGSYSSSSLTNTYILNHMIKKLPDSINISWTNSLNYFFANCDNVLKFPQFILSNSAGYVTKIMFTAYMFYNCGNYHDFELSTFDTSNVLNATSMFQYCSKLINIPIFDFSSCYNVSNILDDCSSLINIGGFKNLGKGYTQKTDNYNPYILNLSYCKKLTHESLMNVINNLYDLNLTYDVAGGGTLYRQSLVLGATNLAKLTEEEIAIATNKGWDIR